MWCYSCGEDGKIHIDGPGGNSVCTACGTVLEENAIVSEVTFGETSGGAAMVQGSYVGADQTRARAPAGYRQKGGGQESREQTILNGRKRIQTLAIALRLPDRLSDAGQRYFNLAVNMNFVQGRRTQYVVAACLYSACRMAKTSHMLIDFSDLLEINVFVLGSTYLKLVKTLTLQLPTVDPSLYISRFAALLEFGDETQKVAQDATRLVARMARDWMHVGRRPAGVCGACLLLAARMNNFRRSITEVVQVVKIADVTLRKRLGEFKDTPSGTLTVNDFRTLWLDETADPPAFSKSQKREKLAREAEDGLLKKKEADDSDEEDGEGAGAEAFAELAAVNHDSPRVKEKSPSTGPVPRPSAKVLGKRKAKKQDDDEEDNDDEDEAEDDEPLAPAPDNAELDQAIAAELDETLGSAAGKVLVDELEQAQKRRIESAKALTNLNEPSVVELNDSCALDDLDESELDCFILTDAEVEAKSRLWMELNKDYLQALADKQTGPDGELRPETQRRVRKRHKPRDSANAQGVDAADATKQMLEKKRFSKKINYSVIKGLFEDGEAEEQDDDDDLLLGSKPVRGKVGGGVQKAPSVARGERIEYASFGARAATPSRSRMSSVAPSARGRSVSVAPRVEPEIEEEDEEEEEEEEEERPARRRPVAAIEEEDGTEDWKTLIAQSKGQEEEVYY